jgi:hypothetical protein
MIKVWFILLENINYTPSTIFNIAYKLGVEDFQYDNEYIYEWRNDPNIEIKMIYNEKFLEDIEQFLINNGILFNWVEYNNEVLGIRIYPSKIDFEPILKDCMTFEEFSLNREYMKIK